MSRSPLPSKAIPARIRSSVLTRPVETRWRPGLADQPLHSEVFASADEASGAGLALTLARDALRTQARVQAQAAARGDPLAGAEADVAARRQVLWVQETRAIRLTGRPCLHGLPRELRDRLIHVEARTAQDALFALEEGLRCRDLACVIGEIVGNPRVLDFTASRRLSLAAEKHGVALWLVRLDAQPDLSSARMRWRAQAAPSARPRWNGDAPGDPAWQAELFRAARHAPGQWIVSDDQNRLRAIRPPARPHTADASLADTAPHPRHLARPTVGRSLAARARL
jgi:protein ImuA